MTETTSNEVIKFTLSQTIDGLRENYGTWIKHNQHGDTILYALLNACLEFHNFLVREADYQSVFKGLCEFRWHKNTGLTTLIAKMVFGHENKQTYTYIKALDAALAKGIGSNGGMGMEQWLKENGGINGVIRKGGDNSKAKVERDFRIQIARNSEKLGLKDKKVTFTCKELAGGIAHGSNDVVILATVDRNTGEFSVKWLSEEVTVRERLWEIRGEAIMATDAYRRNKDAYIEGIRLRNAAAAEKICNAFSKITSLKKIEKGIDNISKVCMEI